MHGIWDFDFDHIFCFFCVYFFRRCCHLCDLLFCLRTICVYPIQLNRITVQFCSRSLGDCKIIFKIKIYLFGIQLLRLRVDIHNIFDGRAAILVFTRLGQIGAVSLYDCCCCCVSYTLPACCVYIRFFGFYERIPEIRVIHFYTISNGNPVFLLIRLLFKVLLDIAQRKSDHLLVVDIRRRFCCKVFSRIFYSVLIINASLLLTLFCIKSIRALRCIQHHSLGQCIIDPNGVLAAIYFQPKLVPDGCPRLFIIKFSILARGHKIVTASRTTIVTHHFFQSVFSGFFLVKIGALCRAAKGGNFIVDLPLLAVIHRHSCRIDVRAIASISNVTNIQFPDIACSRIGKIYFYFESTYFVIVCRRKCFACHTLSICIYSIILIHFVGNFNSI